MTNKYTWKDIEPHLCDGHITRFYNGVYATVALNLMNQAYKEGKEDGATGMTIKTISGFIDFNNYESMRRKIENLEEENKRLKDSIFKESNWYGAHEGLRLINEHLKTKNAELEEENEKLKKENEQLKRNANVVAQWVNACPWDRLWAHP